MPRLDHTVCFVEHEEAELLNLLGELIVLSDTPYVSAYKGTTKGDTTHLLDDIP